ncbi:hypothetical protein ABE197_17305 [Bacillus subtilis]
MINARAEALTEKCKSSVRHLSVNANCFYEWKRLSFTVTSLYISPSP